MPKGFKAAKSAVIAALESGRYLHAARGDIEVKKLLALGAVSAGDVIEVIRACNAITTAAAHTMPCQPSKSMCSGAPAGTSSSISSSRRRGSSVFTNE